MAWIDIDKTGCNAKITMLTFIGLTTVMHYAECLAGLERMLPDPVDTHETAPEMADKGNVQKHNQHKDGVDPVQRWRQPGIITETDK